MDIISWSEFEEEYAQNFGAETGPPAKSFQLALGALIIKEKLGISDRETVEQIRENPYLQHFIGEWAYSNEMPSNNPSPNYNQASLVPQGGNKPTFWKVAQKFTNKAFFDFKL